MPRHQLQTEDIADGSISNLKRADMPDGTISGRALGAGAGVPTDLTPSQVAAIANVSGAILHNTLGGLQGGAANEYYHLTQSDGIEAAAFFNGGSGTHSAIDTHLATTPLGITGNAPIYVTGTSTTPVIEIVPASALVPGSMSAADKATMDAIAAAWSTWSPTWTNFTPDTSPITAKYTVIGKTVHFYIHVRMDGAFSVGAGAVYFTLPIPSVTYPGTSSLQAIGIGSIYDNGTGVIQGFCAWRGTTTAYVFSYKVAGAYVSSEAMSTNAPMTWVTNDEFYLQGTYEAA